MELYSRVRRAVRVEGRSQRDVAREFGLARKTVRKMLEFSEPPGYQRQKPVRRPKLGPWQGVIDAILEDDKQRPKKQRHTAKRIFDRLRAEHAFTGGYTIVKDYVREKKLRTQEVFVPLTHQPGEAQADFGEAVVVIAGVEQKAHFMVFDLPHSDDCFLRAYPAETTEAFLDAHVHAFQYFNGVPTRILYDNTKIAVAQILGNGARKKTQAFSALQSHYLFAEKFGRPAKGNDKGNVEGLVGYARRNFMVPIPCFASWDAFNEHLVEQSRQRRDHRVRGHSEIIAVRFQRDAAAFLPLPAAAYEACEKVTARVSSLSLVRYRTNDYSVPTEYGHCQVLVKGYVDHIEISYSSQIIANHPRSYEREIATYDPLHSLALLEHKCRALDQAAPLTGWQLPECFNELRQLIEARLLKQASREYIQVLRLLENFPMEEVTEAVKAALRLRTVSFDAVRHLLLCRIEHKPPRLDMMNWPHLPVTHLRTTKAADYASLLASSTVQTNVEVMA